MSEAAIVNSLNLGSSKSVLSNDKQSPLAKLLQIETQRIVDDLKKALRERGIAASGNLSKSIVPTPIKITADTVEVAIKADFYWKFVNYGVNGFDRNVGAPDWGTQQNKGSFKEAILGWVKDKGITLPAGFDSYDSFAYAIMANKRNKGMEPRPFMADVINKELTKRLEAPISKLLKRSIEIVISEPKWQ